jgi:hypothetical protein
MVHTLTISQSIGLNEVYEHDCSLPLTSKQMVWKVYSFPCNLSRSSVQLMAQTSNFSSLHYYLAMLHDLMPYYSLRVK